MDKISINQLMEMDLQSLLNATIVSSTKTAQRSAQAPAVVTVITAEEIQERGYGSLADILHGVPGFYDVYDLVTHNIGVRGINGGARSSGGVLKLMIDGQPVDYRPDTGNFFGEELIPLQLVERVEIIRGPASALYGANAFLGVVNVITKKAASGAHFGLVAEGNVSRSLPGGGGGLLGEGMSNGIEFIGGANVLSLNRSDLPLPSSSPVLNGPTGPSLRGLSSNDLARPQSYFAKVSLGAVETGRATLMASVQHLDAVGEFQDFGPLAKGTRISLLNQDYRLTYEIQPRDTVSLKFSGTYFTSAPTALEQFDIGRDDYVLLPSVGASGFELTAEGRVEPSRSTTLVFGADLADEDDLLQTYDKKLTQDVLTSNGAQLRTAGTTIPGANHGAHATFTNVGAFTQGTLVWKDDWSALLGGRVDVHNIYGFNPSLRAAVVYSPPSRPLSLKLLYGSSYKAPSAVQLYTQPMTTLDIQGNPHLKVQTAHTVELVGGFGFADLGELTVNVFATYVIGTVEFVQQGAFLGAQNATGKWTTGGELEARFKPVPAAPLQLRFSTSLARTLPPQQAATVVSGVPAVLNPMFPFYQFHLIGDYRLPWSLQLSVEGSFIGPRTTTQSNALVAGAPYDLPPYLFVNTSLSMKRKILGDRETYVALRVTDLLNGRWADPGFRGVDVPTQGRTFLLTVVQSIF